MGRRRLTVSERLQTVRVSQTSDCLEWTRDIDSNGYGRLRVYDPDGRRRMVPAHRAVYELMVGPIPEGLTIDHLCFNKRCVNLSHLEPVSAGENSRRAVAYYRPQQLAKKCLERGHQREENEKGECVVCRSDYDRREQERLRKKDLRRQLKRCRRRIEGYEAAIADLQTRIERDRRLEATTLSELQTVSRN